MDVDPELRRRVRMAAASKDQSVKEWLEDVLKRGLKRSNEDVAWRSGPPGRGWALRVGRGRATRGEVSLPHARARFRRS